MPQPSTRTLKELRLLDLRGNPLVRLADGMAALPRLEKLDLPWGESLEEPKWLASVEERGCAV
jgi:hypothetical protein